MLPVLVEDHSLEETLEACRFCWMCRHICPVGNETRREEDTPRGFVLTAYGLSSGLLEPTPDAVEILNHCVDCRLCTDWCVSRFRPWEVVQEARAKLSANPLPEPSPTAKPNGKNSGAVALLLHGAASTQQVSAALRMARMRWSDVDTLQVDLGYLARVTGHPQIAEERLARSLRSISQSNCTTLISLSPTDARTLQGAAQRKDFPKGIETVDLLTSLAALPLPRFSSASPIRVAYHDACSGQRTPERVAVPRKLLTAVPGVTLLEFPWYGERAQACGQGGGVPLTQPEVADRLARARISEAAEMGADTIVAEAPECVEHLAGRTEDVGLPTMSLFQMLSERLPA